MRMAEAAIKAVSAVDSVYLNLPNLHFIPCYPVNSEPFADDVYVATNEPSGNIEAVVTRKGIVPHAKL
jgi:urate oxidase